MHTDIDIILKKQATYTDFNMVVVITRKQEITVLFHNDAKFNFRLIIEYLASKCLEAGLFSVNKFNNTSMKIKFIDSFKYLSYALDSLVNYLFNNDKNIDSIKQKSSSLFYHFDDNAIKLLRKSVLPYD